jgi:hypothetical protein
MAPIAGRSSAPSLVLVPGVLIPGIDRHDVAQLRQQSAIGRLFGVLMVMRWRP